VGCKYGGCARSARSFGLCAGHYQLARYSSKHEWMIPESHRKSRCAFQDCMEPSYSNETGLCRKHLAKHERNTLGIDWEALRYYEEMEEPGDSLTIGGRIKNERIRISLTREELANRLGCLPSTVTALERRPVHNTFPSVVARYAKALGVPAGALYPPTSELPEADDPRHGAKLKRARMLRGLTLGDTGELLGCSKERVRQIEYKRTFTGSMQKRVKSHFPELAFSEEVLSEK
jgi:transcriptional regulator with XRE-family HTH domain